MRLAPARTAANARRKATKRPKKTILPPCRRNRVLADLEPTLVKPDVAAVTYDQTEPDGPADQIAKIVPDDRGQSGDAHDGDDVDLVRGSAVESRRDQGGFSGHGHAQAFKHHHAEENPEAVGLDEILDSYGRDEVEHAALDDVGDKAIGRDARPPAGMPSRGE